MKVKTILVPLDGSNLAEAALTPAMEMARESGGSLVLLRAAVGHPRPMADPTEAQVQAVREAEEYLAEVKARVATAGIANAETSVWYGPPVEAIVEAARYRKADLIVMSSHGRTGVGRLVLGSIAESVQRSTSVPILLIRPGDAPLESPFVGATRAKEVARV